jgi:hypothetical protein
VKEPVDHVAQPLLPWREASPLTECGRDVSTVAVVLTREEAVSRFREQGVRRAALSTCMVCLETANRWADWDTDPVQAVGRETARAGRFQPTSGQFTLFRDELLALAELYRRHPEEYQTILAGLQQVANLGDRRARRQRG